MRRLAALPLLLLLAAPLAAQTRGAVPEGREAETLRNAYVLLEARDFAAASEAYGLAEARYAGTPTAGLAARGLLIAEILRFAYSGQASGDDAVMARIQRSSLSQRVDALKDRGLLADAEAAYWLAFIDTGGDAQVLAAQPPFRFLAPATWVQGVMDAAE